MATFVYAPAIRVHVETEKFGILDISDDISQWEVTRRSNAVSSFNFILQNTQRKYDGAFQPMDRITVELKRIVWVRVFTGSLNSVPIFSGWPRALPLSASCSLKKLQFWYWDPATTESYQMISSFVNSGKPQNSAEGDSGLHGLIKESLVKVPHWDPQAIHIGAVPNEWFKWAQKTEQEINAVSSMEAVLGPGATVSGQSVTGLKLSKGSYGGVTLTDQQSANAALIYATTVGIGSPLTSVALQDKAATVAIMVAGGEAGLKNDPYGDGSSLGIFQQIDSWGSAANRENVAWATQAFLKGVPGHPGLFDQKGWESNDNLPSICQGVQQSGTGRASDGAVNYGPWQGPAEAIVKQLRAQVTSKVTAKDSTGTLGTGANEGTPTGNAPPSSGVIGDAVAKVAVDLINSRKSDPIIYDMNASDPTDPKPARLDCSQLVRWVLYHAGAGVWGPRRSQDQYASLKIKDIPRDIAANIRGCLLYGTGKGDGSGFGGAPDHTGISIGDGKNHVAAHGDYPPSHIDDCTISPLPGGLFSGALHPDVDYTAAATSDAAVQYLGNVLKKKVTKSTATNLGSVTDPSVTGDTTQTGSADPFAQLVSALTLNPTQSGNLFGGHRQLMNNQPFLGWLQNLTNSSMRAFCSAPNGDFIAWFPDYFNVWGTSAIMDVKLIELKDFTVEWSDQQIVTHEFVMGSIKPTLDTGSGQIMDGGVDSWSGTKAMLHTQGIASMDFPQIFQAIYGKPATGKFTSWYLARFGGRPNLEAMPNIMHGPQEFYMALWQFMRYWAGQFNATIPMTFMPELWPGMILRIQEHGFQCYVSEVTHRGSYGQGGGFTTEAKIIAPGPIDEKLRGSLFGVLDVFQ